MGTMSALAGIIIFMFLFASVSSPLQSLHCTTVCKKGQFCDGNKCKKCPDGFFQNKTEHVDLECRRWTEKPPNDHWILVSNGSDIADREYGCDKGYKIHQYTTNDVECIKVNTVEPAGVQTTATYETTLRDEAKTEAAAGTTMVPPTRKESNEMGPLTIFVIVLVVLCAITIIIVLVCCVKRDRGKRSSYHLANSHRNERNGHSDNSAGVATTPV